MFDATHPHPGYSRRLSPRIVAAVLTFAAMCVAAIVIGSPTPSRAAGLAPQFVNEQVVSGLAEPDALEFSPDGRMFISERINGRLRVATQNSAGDWVLQAQPFHVFDIPKDSSGAPEAVRSAGLRGITFDPDFASNGFLYAFYMNNATRQNRVVRVKASSADPNVSDAGFGEQVLVELPFNSSSASGSHNGGALVFGNDGLLYITTGDGWTGEFAGDSVQSLSTFTGKVLRISSDGTIPSNNPFFGSTTGSYRSIYALGFRNPYSVAKHPDTGAIYINEARGSNKADIYIVEAGANYGHQGSAIGTLRPPWANSATGGAELVTGGVWYPSGGPFPSEYHGSYFAAMWGSNRDDTGNITRIASRTNTSVSLFETQVGFVASDGLANKPVQTRVGPDGSLYYLLTTYTTSSGTVQRVRYTSSQTVASPTISPGGGTYEDPVTVTISTPTSGAEVRYTTDASEPTLSSPVYSGPISVSTSSVITAKAFRAGWNPSATVAASFTIDDQSSNEPPVVNAGPDRTVQVGMQAALDGSASYDPDGNDELLFGEQWVQLSGPTVDILDASEEVAYFVPTTPGAYTFQLQMSDTGGTGQDDVTITAIADPTPGPGPSPNNSELANGDFAKATRVALMTAGRPA